jgi:hypothetical protein
MISSIIQNKLAMKNKTDLLFHNFSLIKNSHEHIRTRTIDYCT